MENIIWVVLLCAVLALLFAAWKTSVVSKADAGTERMKEIAGNISDGAGHFSSRSTRSWSFSWRCCSC